jgi:nucleotide-binding universal stress UspA family protein
MRNLSVMKKPKNILIAIDGSDSSTNALHQTIKFAKEKNCKVTVLTVLPPYERGLELGIVKNIKVVFRSLGEKILAGALAVAQEGGIQVETVLGEGNTHEAIIDTAQSKDCDLIIVGRRGLTHLDRAFMGSITARVIGYSPIDVLVIPHDSTVKWGNILLAVDGSKYSEFAVDKAISMVRSCGGKINILSVVDVSDELFAQAPNLVKEMVSSAHEMVESVKGKVMSAGIEAEAFVREGETHEKILHMAKELNADLICMGSHGRTGLKRLLMGSVTEKVIGSASLPVLVVKTHE